MLPGMAGFRGPRVATFYEKLNILGLTSNLKWVIDAGDVDSVLTSSQQTLGVIPPGGATIVRGNDSSADAVRDPVHRGTIGDKSNSTYWEMNSHPSQASRRFSSSSSWWENLHKDSAAFTIAGWYRLVAPTTNGNGFLVTMTGAYTDIGIAFGTSPTTSAPYVSGCLYLDCSNGSGTAALRAAGTTVVPDDSDVFIAVSFNEATGSLIFQVGAAQESLSSKTYSSPSASAATYTLGLILAGGVAAVASEVLNRLYKAAFWSTALSAADLTSIYNAGL